MKKTYSKPDIFFEDFSLSTSIAAGCEKKPFRNTSDCGVKWGNIYLFTNNINGCTQKIVDGGTKPGDPSYNMTDKENNALCYHVPTDSFNVFYS